MKTEAMRNELIQWINNLDDQTLLGSLNGIMEATRKGDRADDVSPEERHSTYLEIHRTTLIVRSHRSFTNRAAALLSAL